ncbi:DUF3108 domain-containing protein [Noviherbaspirillum cavernae]|uniref:DUF3108 domain-containing protein n=1 Tax=Noviherbaspirillum cavernae TaxID=2320862 RepID=A0A418WXX7_9BURK|nr:DUF3108 domain-containing protein [Noviherbaspirillum cavernae]RJG04945.1 DUF3108 domain-containing protein [Noviherbaspirillum cavernae]
MASSPAHDIPHRKHRLARLLVVLCASALLHVLFFNWAGGRIGLPAMSQPEEKIITTELRAAPEIKPPAPPEPKPAVKPPKPKARPKPRPRPVAPPPPSPPIAETAAETPSSMPIAGMEAPGTSVEAAAEVAPAAAVAAPPADAPAPQDEQAASYKIDPPPSAELKYDVQALSKGQTAYGHGKISWASAGNSYSIDGEAGVLFITLLNFRSEGMIDEFGVSPVIYTEKRFRRPETNTHFHRERNTISFSASTQSYPRQGGEQDRASIVWQLASIGRGDAGKFSPDAEIEVMVAGVRDAETWRIRVIGQEEIEVGTGRMLAWHVLRIPRPGSYDQKLDIWFAPQHEWYPVKLRFTETNGDYLDMSLSKVTKTTLAATQ